MKRGAIWPAAGGSGYGGKPRPVVIVQDERFDSAASISVVPLTTTLVDAPLFRILVEPSEGNGLRAVSHMMADKITTVPGSKLREPVGQLDADDLRHLDGALVVFLGLAG